MRIALLNLPRDNNYGGNLQRYALMHVLETMGHDVEHINLKNSYSPSFIRQLARWTKRTFKFCMGEKVDFFYEYHMRKKESRVNVYADEFYQKYIHHTCEVYDEITLKKLDWDCFDVVIVGSDQVWRYDMAENSIGIKNFFLSFLSDRIIKKVGYAISLGNYDEDNIENYKSLCGLYQKFSSVSFRENAALEYSKKIGWSKPEPKVAIDPTLLLTKEDYINLFRLKLEKQDFIFCYILDKTQEKIHFINQLKDKYRLPLRRCSLEIGYMLEIPKWIEHIMNAAIVVTDSYHGVVFSVLFEKKLFFLGNERRGNERIRSLFETLHVSIKEYNVENSTETPFMIEENRKKSLEYLRLCICGD